jgi:hypothetical protein
MFAINDKTQVPDYEKLPLVPADSDVTILLTVAKDLKGLKGHYAIFEGKVIEVAKGSMAKGQGVKALMVQLDDNRRILRQQGGGEVNYAVIEVIKFLETVNGEPFPKENLNAAVEAMCAQISGMAVRIVAAQNPGNAETKPFVERTFIHVPNQNLEAQRKSLASL